MPCWPTVSWPTVSWPTVSKIIGQPLPVPCDGAPHAFLQCHLGRPSGGGAERRVIGMVTADVDLSAVGGQKGEGLFFVNAFPNGEPDRRTVHAGRPPTQGEKWVVSQFMRSRPLF